MSLSGLGRTLLPIPLKLRTHTGCDAVVQQDVLRYLHVSIHAPTRGATGQRHGLVDGCLVSIHAPTRGATLQFELTRPAISFNPRTHTGCDQTNQLIFNIMKGFNPRTHTGCDVLRWSHMLRSSVSIHAPTRGATPLSLLSSFMY